ncbi:hypothetical protein E6R60_26665 [Streptomyces sp. A0642]|uniref:hypothetical protein n=1 Tax=Streptomyces sp. A0642 TaxID=2563100 RepID=UPI0010A264E8|nr:hypothetical protein [Streptomyces sp. A0642]THA72515.1 hypothetical protein E6R60_26665 [Streptomyces sp. A0642]
MINKSAPAAKDATMPKTTPAQQRALDLMRTRHTGAIESGEGTALPTVLALAKARLCTVEIRHAADGILRSTRHRVFTATLTEAGWAGHERPAAPELPAATPEAELHQGDIVRNIHTATLGKWHGPSAYDPKGFTVHVSGSTLNTGPGCWQLVSRAQEQPERPEPAPTPDGPQTTAYSAQGAVYRIGQRVALRTTDGFLYSGPVREFTRDATGRTLLTFDADTRQIAPARRPPLGAIKRPFRRISVTPPEPWTVPLDATNLTTDA